MSKQGAILAERIISEIKELSFLVERINHSFYSGVERIFERIAVIVDNSMPSGANWHQELLNQMALEIPGIRPAVISSSVKEQLEEYRGFRHIVRNIYSYRFNPEKMNNLVSGMGSLFLVFSAELTSFAEFLKSVEIKLVSFLTR